MGFKIYGYKGGVVYKKILGFPVIKKDDTLTLLIAGLPIAQRKQYVTQLTGGGDSI